MKAELIKPIPKYIVQKIHKMDLKNNPQNGYPRYYSYLTTNDKELVKVTCCVKNFRKKWYIKQCVVHGLDSDICFVKDIYFSCIAGYKTGWYFEGLSKRQEWYENGQWGWQYDNLFDVYAPVVNIEFLDKYSEFKYSAYKEYSGDSILPYLRQYRKYPECEYLVKLGLSAYTDSTRILSLLHKDKGFRKYIGKHKDDLRYKYYYINTIIKAYKENLDLDGQYYEKCPKTPTSLRDVPIPEILYKELVNYKIWYMEKAKDLDTNPDKYYLMCNLHRKPASSKQLQDDIVEIRKKYKLKKHITCHGLRHTYCSLLLTQSIPIQTVSRYMGHSNSTVTLKVYTHFIPDTQIQFLETINKAFS